MELKKVKLTQAECALDMGDGSERGFYVNQDYLLRKMKKVHRGISLMYTYYPKDAGWPLRACEAFPKNKDGGAWNFPYEDYFPYMGGLKNGLNGNREGEPFCFMKDIRQRGQDVVLTLTVDPHLEDEYLIAVAKDLRPYGRLLLRVNHECTGTWFCFNKRATYQELADFFVRFAKILKKYAPNVKTILCAGMYMENEGKIEMEDIFLEAHKIADIWSGDNYLSLHWGWPNDIAEKGCPNMAAYDVDSVYEKARKTVLRLREITGQDKPFVMSEMNADGDVTGAVVQANTMRYFMEKLEKETDKWLTAFTLYQFRDDGRLGLEVTDPNNPDVGIEQPLFEVYKKQLHKPFFTQPIVDDGKISLPAKLRWGGAEDAEGVAIPLKFEKQPVFAEAYFNGELEDANLMLELGGYWFYKKPGVKCVDFMTLFWDKPLTGATEMELHIFAPPASGLNNYPGMEEGKNVDDVPNGDWMTDTYSELKALPEIRLRFEEPALASRYE